MQIKVAGDLNLGVFQMSALQRRITIMANLIAQLRELDQLRERVGKARLNRSRRSRRIDHRKRGRI
jgi:hypothetical protein